MKKLKKKIILAIAGDIASGKNEMAAYIENRHGGCSYRSSEVLRDILGRMYLESNRENMQKVSTMIREYFGSDIISKVAALDLARAKNKIIAINGVRRLSDIVVLKKDFEVKLIYIQADKQKRFERIKKRAENPDDRKKTFVQFKRDHAREAEKQIAGLKPKADYIIENNGTKKEFYEKIDEVIKKLK